jgi:hypothetical protein
MTNSPDIETPVGLQWSGRKLWEATVADFELSEHEVGLLLQACRTVDALDQLQARLDADGPMVQSPQGLKAHPALPELRQQRIALARLLVAIGLPSGVEDDEQPKAQRRSVRGAYKPQSARS